ncbi:MAG TPA: orotate phosphoribosyltransferase [Gemmatimonadota bacterium]|nr:orotate phosphoribosyltransferase [Gemmatimonadota bacterium]
MTSWLDRLRQSGALLEGHFLLSSGFHSPRYVQCARLLQHPSEAQAAGRDLAARLAAATDARPDLVVSPAIGGIVLGQEVARALGCRAIWAERGLNGGLELRRGFVIDAGERAIAVEDVITTAGSLRELIGLIERAGGVVGAVATLVDRSGGGIAWEVPAVSLVRIDAVRHPADQCPQCAAGIPAVKPGSRPG